MRVGFANLCSMNTPVSALPYSPEFAIPLTEWWVKAIVIDLNLCPFASAVVKKATIRYAVCEGDKADAVVQAFLAELDLIQSQPENELATTLLIAPNMLHDFEQYLDTLDILQSLLERSGLGSEFQLASFHPQYQFDGVAENDVTNWTNRAPFPSFHLLREGMMTRLLQNYANPDDIPERNIALMQELGPEGLIDVYPPFSEYALGK